MLIPENYVDLHVHDYGFEKCEPGHDYGPAVREYYLFHYILSGKGLFQVNENHYDLQEGQGFLIYPKLLTYYKADHYSPWTYCWIGISGLRTEEFLRQSGMTRENPIWQGGKDERIESCLMKMKTGGFEPVKQMRNTAYAYLFLARLIEKSNQQRPSPHKENRQESYLRSAIRYMEQNYCKKINIDMIASNVGLDRNYLGTIFKKHLHTTMQDFLINLRMSKACELLKHEDIRISDIARSVGYTDQLHFSKIFKQRKGVSPVSYKNSHNRR